MNTDLQRRRVAIAALTLAAGSAYAARADSREKPAINIEAPDDVFVVAVHGAGNIVKAGDLILELKSYRLTQWQSRLSMYAKQVEILERPFHDGRVDDEIKLLKAKANNLKNIRDIAASRLATADSQVKLGLRLKSSSHYLELINVSSTTTGSSSGKTGTQESSSTGVTQSGSTSTSTEASTSNSSSTTTDSSTTKAQAANPQYMTYEDISTSASQTDNDYLDAQTAAGQADRKRQDALDKIALTKEKLSEQQQILNNLLDAMQVAASTDGTFEQVAGVGSFIKKGHLLGRILL